MGVRAEAEHAGAGSAMMSSPGCRIYRKLTTVGCRGIWALQTHNLVPYGLVMSSL